MPTISKVSDALVERLRAELHRQGQCRNTPNNGIMVNHIVNLDDLARAAIAAIPPEVEELEHDLARVMERENRFLNALEAIAHEGRLSADEYGCAIGAQLLRGWVA